MRFLLVGVGGFLGANARYILGGWLARTWSMSFPYETLVINVTGSFILTFFMTIALGRFNLSPEYRLMVAVGFVGSYTTFSTLTYETLLLVEQGGWLRAGMNLLLSAVLGMAAAYAGLLLGRLI